MEGPSQKVWTSRATRLTPAIAPPPGPNSDPSDGSLVGSPTSDACPNDERLTAVRSPGQVAPLALSGHTSLTPGDLRAVKSAALGRVH